MVESASGDSQSGLPGPRSAGSRLFGLVAALNWRNPWVKASVPAAAVIFVCLGIWTLNALSTSDIQVEGLPGHAITPATASGGVIQVRTEPDSDTRVLVDGKPVAVQQNRDTLLVRPPWLPDGAHELRVSVPSAIPFFGDRSVVQPFTVDATPPVLRTEPSIHVQRFTDPVTISGTAGDAAQVVVGGRLVKPDPKGAFSATVPNPPATIDVVATDAAGNRSTASVAVKALHPPTRGVHMTGLAWSAPELREPVLQMAREKRIDTVELDIKDEDGEIPYDSKLPMPNQIGAVKNYYNARQVIDQLHGMGVRVVGRLVAFRDPALGGASWQSGHPERVVQTPDGGPYGGGGYGTASFTNFADPAVRQYNVDIATEAASLGFDDILYDYVRRPDGPIDSMRFPGLTTTPERGIADFVDQTRTPVRAHGAFLGASVFGISFTRPTEIAQDIPAIAAHADYVAPMVYPSHWGPGEYGIGNPNDQPYEIVRRSLVDGRKAVEGSDAQVIPWLQDFSLGANYGPGEVAAQISAARDDGLTSFLLWDPNCRYHAEALPSGG